MIIRVLNELFLCIYAKMDKSTTALRSKDNEKWNADKMFLPFLIVYFQSSIFSSLIMIEWICVTVDVADEFFLCVLVQVITEDAEPHH